MQFDLVCLTEVTRDHRVRCRIASNALNFRIPVSLSILPDRDITKVTDVDR